MPSPLMSPRPAGKAGQRRRPASLIWRVDERVERVDLRGARAPASPCKVAFAADRALVVLLVIVVGDRGVAAAVGVGGRRAEVLRREIAARSR